MMQRSSTDWLKIDTQFDPICSQFDGTISAQQTGLKA